MEALIGIVELGKAGTLKDEPFYKGCPPLSPAEAELFGSLMDQGKIRIHILSFDAPGFMTYGVGRRFASIDMRPDTAAVVRGIMGFDPSVYRAQNKNLVQIVKDISRDGKHLLRHSKRS